MAMADLPTTGHALKPLQFSTRGLPERERVPMWREVFGRTIVRVDMKPVAEVPLHAQATLRSFPGFRTISCATSPMYFRRTPDLLRDGDDSVGLVVNLGHQAMVSHCGIEVRMAGGDAVPIFTHKAADLLSTRHVGMVFPRASLASRVRSIDKAAGRMVPRRTEALRLLVTYIKSLNGKQLLATPGLSEAVVNHIYDLAALALDPELAAASCLSATAAARLAGAIEMIARRFADPALSTDMVAKQQNISARYLQRLIETTGKPFAERVNELRLQRAFDLLTAPGSGKQRIAHIALEAGFSDVSYFNRLFRARFGDTPTGVRGQRADQCGQADKPDRVLFRPLY
jgi:AraC-like DNA-binding protein